MENRHQVTARSTHHYVTLDVDSEGILVRAVDLDGTEFDRLHIDVSDTVLTRRHHFLAQDLERDFQIASLVLDPLHLPFTLANPFDHELRVQVNTSDSELELGPDKSFVLAPGQKRDARVDLKGYRPAFDSEPWRADLIAPLEFTFSSQDQALPVLVERKLNVDPSPQVH